MTEREKLLNLIDEAAELHRSEREAIADHLIANGVTVQKWIPVEERLPDGKCIAINGRKDMMIGYIYDSEYSDTGYSAEDGGAYLYDVTHWMPLPEPPKEEA